jgi:CRP-like cAMP-binding protein
MSERYPGLASSLSPEELELLLDAFELHDAAAGEALVAEGTASSDLFLVWDGQLDVTQAGPTGERPLAQLGPGSYFGEVSLFDPGPASASVVTQQGCVTLRLSRARLDELRKEHPEVAAPLLAEALRALLARLRGATALLEGRADAGAAA